jgi:hypothetical protein
MKTRLPLIATITVGLSAGLLVGVINSQNASATRVVVKAPQVTTSPTTAPASSFGPPTVVGDLVFPAPVSAETVGMVPATDGTGKVIGYVKISDLTSKATPGEKVATTLLYDIKGRVIGPFENPASFSMTAKSEIEPGASMIDDKGNITPAK